MNILMSIRSKYAEEIFNNQKKWEFRRSLPARISDLSLTRVLVYSSGVDKAIIGTFTIKRLVRAPFDELMTITNYYKDADIVKRLSEYYKDMPLCGAIEIKNPVKFDQKVNLEYIMQCIPIFRPPQNYIYLSNDNSILKLIN